MSKKDEIAMRFFVAYIKCDCAAAEKELSDPAYDIDTRVYFELIRDPSVRVTVNSKTRGEIDAAFAAACPQVLDKMQAISALNEGMDEYAEVIEILRHE